MFDPVFGLGYGEENDFCMRAAAAGYRNVLCDDAFVLHLGGSSFGDKRADLGRAQHGASCSSAIRSYLDLVRAYIAADPLRPLRELALSQYRVLTNRSPGVLHVIHGHGGGTEYHVRALIAASSHGVSSLPADRGRRRVAARGARETARCERYDFRRAARRVAGAISSAASARASAST